MGVLEILVDLLFERDFSWSHFLDRVQLFKIFDSDRDFLDHTFFNLGDTIFLDYPTFQRSRVLFEGPIPTFLRSRGHFLRLQQRPFYDLGEILWSISYSLFNFLDQTLLNNFSTNPSFFIKAQDQDKAQDLAFSMTLHNHNPQNLNPFTLYKNRGNHTHTNSTPFQNTLLHFYWI